MRDGENFGGILATGAGLAGAAGQPRPLAHRIVWCWGLSGGWWRCVQQNCMHEAHEGCKAHR